MWSWMGAESLNRQALTEQEIGDMMAPRWTPPPLFRGLKPAGFTWGISTMKHLLAVLILGFFSGCANYGGYPSFPGGAYGGGYGYPYPPPVNYGYGGYPAPAYGYYPGPVYYGRSYGGYGYSEHEHRPPVSHDQKALNYIYDHRNQIQHLPPQQQREVLREANKIIQHNNAHQHRHHSD